MATVTTPTKPIHIFYSYAHNDIRYREEIEKYLELLRQDGTITEWNDRDISPGTEWQKTIEYQLEKADVIMLLVSMDFLASEFIHSVELKRAMQRHDAQQVRVIPILLRDCDWRHSPISKLQMIPSRKGRLIPVEKWRYKSEAYQTISEKIRIAVEELAEHSSKLRSAYERGQKLFKQGRGSVRLVPYLEHLYNKYPLFEYSGEKYPIVVFSIPPEQGADPNFILSPLELLESNPNDFLFDDTVYLSMRQSAPGRLDNDPTYAATKLELKPLPKIHARLGTYFLGLRTSDALEWEILNYFGEHAPARREFDNIIKMLPNREKLHRHVLDPVKNYDGRSAMIAMSTLVAFNTSKDGYIAIVSWRSSDVAVHGHLYHVIPSFMFQPVRKEWAEKEWSVTHQLYREFLEELFGQKEIGDPNGSNIATLAYDWFYKRPTRLELETMLRDGRASFHVTGIGVNLLNLRPEILTVLIIKDPAWYESHGRETPGAELISLNWEWAREREHQAEHSDSGTQTRLYRAIPISKDTEIPIELKKQDQWVPPGAAAFWLGVNRVRQIVPQEAKSE